MLQLDLYTELEDMSPPSPCALKRISTTNRSLVTQGLPQHTGCSKQHHHLRTHNAVNCPQGVQRCKAILVNSIEYGNNISNNLICCMVSLFLLILLSILYFFDLCCIKYGKDGKICLFMVNTLPVPNPFQICLATRKLCYSIYS